MKQFANQKTSDHIKAQADFEKRITEQFAFTV
jgi:hypothetical protein